MAWQVGDRFVWEETRGLSARLLRVGTIQRVTASGRGVDVWDNVWLPDGREYGGKRTAHRIDGWYAERLEAQGRAMRAEETIRILIAHMRGPAGVSPELDEALGRVRDLIRIAGEV